MKLGIESIPKMFMYKMEKVWKSHNFSVLIRLCIDDIEVKLIVLLNSYGNIVKV